MALAPYFDRVYGAVGGHLGVSRESLTHRLSTVTVGISLPSRENLSENEIWIAELTTNLLSRLYPRLAILGTHAKVGPLRSLALSINPSIDVVGEAPPETTIAVTQKWRSAEIVACAKGWCAEIRHSTAESSTPSNPYSSAAAASLGCGALFRRIFLGVEAEPDLSLSLLRYDATTGDDLDRHTQDIGNVWFAGVGAIGNAALWALARDKNLRGKVVLIDSEELSNFNLQRYVLGTVNDVGQPKVNLGRRALRSTQLRVVTAQTTLEEFAARSNKQLGETIVVSVDNIASRRAAQALLPRLVVNGFTGDQALGASWHEFDRNFACLACLYQPTRIGASATEQAARALGLSHERAALLWVTKQPLTASELVKAAQTLGVEAAALDPWAGKSLGDLYTDAVCGAVPLDVRGLGRVETVPLAHQSMLAGTMMAAELLKRTSPDLAQMSQPECLVSYDDILRAAPSTWAKPRAKEPRCICSDVDYQAVYAEKWPRVA